MPTLRHIAVRDTGSRKPGDGLNGAFYSDEIGPVHVFRGPSDTRKTTRLLTPVVVAVGLAQTQTDTTRPNLGPLPQRTDAALTFDMDGETVEIVRDLSVGPTAKASRETVLQVAEVMGLPPVAWDMRDFLGATDNERAKLVDQVLRAGGSLGDWTVERVVADLPASPLLDQLRGSLSADQPAAEWVAAALLWSGPDGGIYTQRNKAERDARAHLDALLAEPVPVVDGDAVADATTAEVIRSRIAAEQAALAEVERATVVWDAWVADGNRLRAAVVSATERLAAADVAIPDDVDPSPLEAAVADATARLDAARAAVAEARALVIKGRPVDCAAEEQALGDAQTALEAAREAHRLAEEGYQKARAAYAAVPPVDPALAAKVDVASIALDEAVVRAARLREAAAAAQSRLQAMSEAGTDAVCVHCGAADPLGVSQHIAEARTAAMDTDELASDADALVSMRRSTLNAARTAQIDAETARAAALDRARKTGDDAASVRAAAAMQVAQATEYVGACVSTLERARTAGSREAEAERARRIAEAVSAEDVASKALQAAREVLATAKQANADREAQRERRDAAKAAAHGSLATAQEALDAWSASTAPPQPADAERVAERIEAARVELHPITARIEARRAARDATERIDRARKSHADADALLAGVKALRAALERVRDEIASEAYRPITDACNGLLERCGGEVPFRVYFDGPVDFGTIDSDGTRIPYAGSGEGRETVLVALLAFAFATVSGCRWRPVLLDGLEAMPTRWAMALLAALVEARAAGEVHNVIATWQTDDRSALPDGVTVTECGDQLRVAA